MLLVPLDRYQTASGLPAGSNPTCGDEAFCPATETSTGVPNMPPAGRNASCAMSLVPLERIHTASALPDASNATCGEDASCPELETSTGVANAPLPTARKALWTMELVPLERDHTTSALPDAYNAICGCEASCPAAE